MAAVPGKVVPDGEVPVPQWLADIAMTSGPVVVVTPVLALAATLVALATYRLRAGAFAFGAGVAGAGIGLLAA